MRSKFYKIIFVFLLCIGSFQIAIAGPWLLPGDMGVKSDIDLLASYNYIKAPVLTWPIAWRNIGPDLMSKESIERIKKDSPAVQMAYQRILNMYKASLESYETTAEMSAGDNINPFRTFASQPRSDFDAKIATAYTNESSHFAGKLALTYGDYDDLTQPVHLDDSYFYGLFGNWAVGFDKFNRWWSPAYSDSMILSMNAPALPTFTIQRLQSYAPTTKWLKWLGPWSLTSSLSVGSPDTPVTYPMIWLTNFSFRPVSSLQIGMSRVAYFAGTQRPLTWKMLLNLLTFQDNTSCYGVTKRDSPGTEHAEISVVWTPAFLLKHMPSSIYLHTIFNDSYRLYKDTGWAVPFRTNFVLGESTEFLLSSGLLRIYFEYEYMIQNCWYYWNVSGYTYITNIYGYSKYPYYYYEKIIGSPLGGESFAYNFGAIFNESYGNSDYLSIRYLKLNTKNLHARYGYPFNKQDVIWASVGRIFVLPYHFGNFSGQIGCLEPINGSGLHTSLSVQVRWSKIL